MKRRSLFFFFLMFALFAHLLLFGRAVEPRLTLVPEWVLDPYGEQPVTRSASGSRGIPFLLPERFGYASPDGALLFSSAVPPGGVAINSERLAAGGNLYDSSGTFRSALPADRHPYFSRYGTYLISPRRESLLEIDGGGAVVWERHTGSVITCFADSPELRLIGTLDGKAILMRADGATETEFTPSGSSVSAVYGAAVSEDGGRVALVSGIGPQLLVLYEKSENGWQMRGDWELPGSMHTETRVEFLGGGSHLRVERPELLITVNLLSGSSVEYAGGERYIGSYELEETGLSAALFGGDSGRFVLFDARGEALAEIGTRLRPFLLDGADSLLLAGFRDLLAAFSFDRL